MMIDLILSKIDKSQTKEIQIHQIREQLQFLILKIISDQKFFLHVAFLGGTALRLCHKLQRYSEDLDFSLVQKDGYDFLSILQNLILQLRNYGFEVELKYKQGIIDNAYIRFSNILQKSGLSQVASQKISIKLEIDTNPPLGYKIETLILNNIFMFPVNVFDLPSLFAGKLHAILYRSFIKGRDRYDLIWYISNNIHPNFQLLQNAETQTNINKVTKTISELKLKILIRLNNITTKELLDDVANFLYNENDKLLLEKENIITLINRW